MAQSAQSVETRLRLAIKQAVLSLKPAGMPTIWAKVQTNEGYRAVEDAVISLVVNQQLTPAQALAHLESEWS